MTTLRSGPDPDENSRRVNDGAAAEEEVLLLMIDLNIATFISNNSGLDEDTK